MSEATSSCMINNPKRTWHRFFHGKYEDFAGTKLWEKAKDELNEIPDKREQDIKYLRNLIIVSREPGLKCDLSDSFLLKFLRVRKFDPERAMKLVFEYYQAQANYPSIYEEYWPTAAAEVFKEGVVTVLPDTDREDRAIIIFRFCNYKVPINKVQFGFGSTKHHFECSISERYYDNVGIDLRTHV